MEYQAPESTCNLCGSTFKRQGMTRHLKSCLSKQFDRHSGGRPAELLHLHVADAYNPDYFLHLLVSAKASLGNLDRFLRDIWLECCGHMSAFSYERYGDEIPMKRSVKAVLTPGVALYHQYDFGSTTELVVKAVDGYQGALGGKEKIRVLARNAQPIIPCDECSKKPAVQICTQCQWSEGGWLCEDCARTHACDEEMFLPVVNSPRTGVCGYTGGIE